MISYRHMLRYPGRAKFIELLVSSEGNTNLNRSSVVVGRSCRLEIIDPWYNRLHESVIGCVKMVHLHNHFEVLL